jgi:ABC-type antimicrobial peptide transport system permease subunit
VRPAVFTPFFQRYRGDMTLHVRTTGELATMLAAVRREVQVLDASLPLYNTRTLEEQKTSSLYTSRLAATLLTMFGLLALLLAAVGLYGVMAYTVNRRTHEIGIRMALGAQGSEVRRLVMVEGTAIMTIGLLLGLGGALAGTRLVESFLYGVRPNDPIAFAGAGLLLAAVTLLANYLPARRASRTDPLMAIRR